MASDYSHVWVSKDTLPRELQFLQPLDASNPQSARVMVGPRQLLFAQDPTAQTLASSAVVTASIQPNILQPGIWTPPAAGVGLLYEAIRANILAQDNSGKLQVTLPLTIATSPSISPPLGSNAAPIPFLLPAVIGAQYEIRLAVPAPPYLPTDGSFTVGPQAQIGLINTDGAASHTYKRSIVVSYRYIYDVDYSKERVYVMGTLT